MLAASAAAGTVALVVGAGEARAQYGMGMPGGGMPNPPMGGQQQPKDEGPAEQAPEEDRPSDLEPLTGYSEQSRRRSQLFELDGYFRMRTDYMHNFFLGQGYTSEPWTDSDGVPRQGLPPFPTPLSCASPTMDNPMAGKGACGDKNVSAANVRLRLEPTFNVTDQVRVRSQIDVLDNTIMGSTPDSLSILGRNYGDPIPGAPAPVLYNSQDPPEVGANGYQSSIRAKRAWAEVDTEFGSLRFGRMPWHFGRGMVYNDGSCLDCTGGTTVDRLALLTEVYGHQLTLALDFGPQGLTSKQLRLGRASPDGYPIDLAQDDDVFQYMAALTRIDGPVRLRERIDRGEVVVNYGTQVVLRRHQMAVAEDMCLDDLADADGCTVRPPNMKEDAPPTRQVHALMVMPNVWMKMHYRALTLEFEGAAVLGKMDAGGILLADGEESRRLTMRQFGWVAAAELRLYRDAFFLGFETGGATGDQAEDRTQYLNYRWKFVRQPAGDHALHDFKFSPEYHVDSIFFRHILGTVTNAIYVKPAVAYWFDLQKSRQLGLNGSFVYSMAHIPVATPGNALAYGLEMNAGLTYRNTGEGFYAGMTWGVFWPMGALNRPGGNGVEALWPNDPADAKAAQVLRGFLGIKF
jgi:uncharacterized protein (TIGR04551 family)